MKTVFFTKLRMLLRTCVQTYRSAISRSSLGDVGSRCRDVFEIPTKVVAISLLLITLGIGNMWGAEKVIEGKNITGFGSGTNYTEGSYDAGDGFTISSNGGFSTKQFRVGKSKTLTISLSSGTITKIVFTASSTSYLLNADGISWSDLTGTYTSSGTSSVTFTNGSGNIARITNIVITYSTGSCSADPTVAAGQLKGSFDLTQVGVATSDCSAGANCAWTDYGFVWGTASNPTVSNNKVQVGTSGSATTWDGTLSGPFTAGTKYYYRAYGKNGKTDAAVVYGTQGTFIPRSITFNSNGGSSVSTIYVNDGSKASAPTAPTKTGYTFAGWYQESGLTNAVNWSSTITQNKTYYAKWTAKTTTVTLDRQSGTGGSTSVTATYGSAMPTATMPTRTGYNFGGYYTAANGGGTQYYTATGTSARNWDITDATKTLYAKWTAKTLKNYRSTCSCTGFSFHYGPTSGDWPAPMCFEQVNSTNEWQIKDFVIGSSTAMNKFYVGYQENFYNNNLGSANSKSATVTLQDKLYLAETQNCGNKVSVRSASNSADGAKGTLRIYSNYSDENLYCGFLPDGYGFMYGATGKEKSLKMTQTATGVWETETVELTADMLKTNGTYKYQVGLATATDGTYVACGNSSAQNFGSMGSYYSDAWRGNVSTYAVGTPGKFEIWSNSCNNGGSILNWVCHFVPYYVINYYDLSGEIIDTEYVLAGTASTKLKTVTGLGWTTKGKGYSASGDVTNAFGSTYSFTSGTNVYNFYLVAAGYQITYSVPGCASVSPASVTTNSTTLPTPTGTPDGYTFVGWTTSAITTETTTEPVMYSAGTTYNPSAAITLYACYKRTEGSVGGSQDFAVVSGTSYTFTNNYYYVITPNRSGTGYLLGNEVTAQNRIIAIESTSVSNTKMAMGATETSAVWIAEKNGDYWNLKNMNNGKYLASNGTYNQIALVDAGSKNTDAALWSLNTSTSGETFRLVCKAKVVKSNTEYDGYLKKYVSGQDDMWAVNNGYSSGYCDLYIYERSQAPSFGITYYYTTKPPCKYVVTVGSPDNVTITAKPGSGSAIAEGGNSGATVASGTTVTLSGTADACYENVRWTVTRADGGADVLTNSTSTSFTMPESDVTVTASVSAKTNHTISFVSRGVSGAVGTNTSLTTITQTVCDGGTLTFPSYPTDGAYTPACGTFYGWTNATFNESATQTANSTPTDIHEAGSTLTNITANNTYYAVFVREGTSGTGVGNHYSNHAGNYTISGKNTSTATITDGLSSHENITVVRTTSSNAKYSITLPSGTCKLYIHALAKSNASTDAMTVTATSGSTGATFTVSTPNPNVFTKDTWNASSNPSSITMVAGYYFEIDCSGVTEQTVVSVGNGGIILLWGISIGTGSYYYSTKPDCPADTPDNLTVTYHANSPTGQDIDVSNLPSQEVVSYTSGTWPHSLSSTIPTTSSYVFAGWNTSADGFGTDYAAGQSIAKSSNIETLNLYAKWVRVYTVTFNDQGTATNRTQASSGAAVSVPNHTAPCDMAGATWEFAGWSKTGGSLSDAASATIDIAANTTTYTPSAADDGQTFFAVYKKTSTTVSEFSVGKSGVYKIYFTCGSKDYYACNSQTSGIYANSSDQTDYFFPQSFRLTYYTTGTYKEKYTIQREDGQYVGYSGSSTGLSFSDSPSDNKFYWTIAASNGGYTVQNVNTITRYFNGDCTAGSASNFNAKTANDVVLKFAVSPAVSYFTNMACLSNFTLSFDNGGGTINWATGHAKSTYEDVVDGTIFSTFPTATYDGWTFIGWTLGQGYSDMTKYASGRDAETGSGIMFPEDADVYGGADGVSGNSYTIHSNATMYPIFTQFPDNEPFDNVNGGDYYIYYLESGSNDGYGAEKRVYAGDYADKKRYRSTQNCASATVFTFTKLANGKWTIYDNSTKKYLYSETSGNEIRQGTTAKEWTITVKSGNQFDAYQANKTYQLQAWGSGSSATFQNYEAGNLSQSGYHRVYLGGCSERVFSSHPSNVPEITLNGGNILLTTTKGQKVWSQDVLTVSAKNIATSSLTITSSNAAFSVSPTSIAVSGHGVTLTNITVTYNPTLTTDGIESTVITVSDGAPTPTTAQTKTDQVRGRHLTEDIAIVVKVGDQWLALPSNMSGVTTYGGDIVFVDNLTNPTKVTYAMNTDVWHLRQAKSGTRYNDHGYASTFVNGAGGSTDKPLYATTSTSGTGIGVDAQYQNYNSTNPEQYEWQLTTADFVTYTIKTDLGKQTNKTLTFKTSENSWGLYGSGAQSITDLRILPIENKMEELGYSIIEWRAQSSNPYCAVAGLTSAITKLPYKVFNDEAQTNITSSISEANCAIVTGDVAKVTGSFSSYGAGKLLVMYDSKTSPTKMTIVELPQIINGSTSLSGTHAGKNIVVGKGGTLTIGTANIEIKDLTVMGGGKVVMNANTKTTGKVTMRGGYSYIDDSFTMPQLYIKKGVTFSGSTSVAYDYVIDNNFYYWISVPYEVTFANVTDEVGSTSFKSWVKYYDGEQRASGDQVTGWKKYTGSKFEVGKGYTVAAKVRQDDANPLVKSRKYAFVHFPLKNNALLSNETSGELSTTKSVEVTAPGFTGGVINDGLKDNNVGWNLLGNPFITKYKLSDNAGTFAVGSLEKTIVGGKWTGDWHWENKSYRYVTLPKTLNDDDYEQLKVSDAIIPAFTPFFIQVKSPGTLTFANVDGTNRQSMPAFYAPQQQEREVDVDIMLDSEDDTDNMGLLIGNKFSEAYEFGDDLVKMMNNKQLAVYSITTDHHLAFNAINEQMAATPIPVGYQAPKDGDYIFRLADNIDLAQIESIQLIDLAEGMTTDLLYSDYEFITKAGVCNDRFAISVRLRESEVITNLDTEEGELDNVRVNSENGQITLVGLSEGIEIYVYDMTGKLAAQTTSNDSRVYFNVPNGFYNIRLVGANESRTIKTVVR